MTMKDYLERCGAGAPFGVKREEVHFSVALEAAQREWIELPGSGILCDSQGAPFHIMALGLTSAGREALDRLKQIEAEKQPSAKMRRAGRWLGMKFRDMIFMVIGAILIELIKRLF